MYEDIRMSRGDNSGSWEVTVLIVPGVLPFEFCHFHLAEKSSKLR